VPDRSSSKVGFSETSVIHSKLTHYRKNRQQQRQKQISPLRRQSAPARSTALRVEMTCSFRLGGKETATAEADPYGMTNKRTGNGNGRSRRTDNGKSAGEECRFPPIAEDAMDGAPGQLQAVDYSVAVGLGAGSFSGPAFVG
jgi:hypothetical protein